MYFYLYLNALSSISIFSTEMSFSEAIELVRELLFIELESN